MSKKDSQKRTDPTPGEVEELFSDVDETGHTNASKARKEHKRRRSQKDAVEIDPLSGDDPSGSSISKMITKTAVGFVVIMLLVVILSQVACGVIRRSGTAQLSVHTDVKSVASALKNGVEWGNGFTQFPEDFSVQEADENTGRIEVTVVDTSSKDELESLSGSQIQATALSVNALLNPKINTVIYHVTVHTDEAGNLQQSSLFGFFKPTGTVQQFATFIWTKTVTDDGSVNFNCMITGLDSDSATKLRDKVTLPSNILDSVLHPSNTTDAQTATTGEQTDTTSSDEADPSTVPTTEPVTAPEHAVLPEVMIPPVR